MKKIFFLSLIILITSFSFAQSNVLVIDYNNAFSSDQQNNGSRIYNRLVATQTSVVRIASIPATISNVTYDEVWIFGNMGGPSSTNLSPIITFMNNGGAVYVQSEVGCCNNQAAFVDALIDSTTIAGGSIVHSITKSSDYQFQPGAALTCTPWVSHGAALRPFAGTPAANILFEANAVCSTSITTGDIVGVQFSACDLISGQGALISTGDFNIFPLSGTCTSVGILNTPNNFVIIDLIANLFDSLLICSSPNTNAPTVNPILNDTVCAGDTIFASAFTSTPVGATFNWTNSNTGIGLTASGSGNTPIFIATNSTGNPITGTISVTATIAACTGPPTIYNITVNPTPTVNIPSNQTFCSGDTIATYLFTSVPSGGTFIWTNSNPAIGLSTSSGVDSIPAFIATNSTNAPISSTITVTPTANNCVGLPVTYTITINPTPTITAPQNIIYCPGDTIPASTFTSNPLGATYTWTNSNTAVGLGASGSGNTPVFIATNSTSSTIISTITVTPILNGCAGIPITYTITVNPSSLSLATGNMLVCLNDSIILTANGSGNGTITWYSDALGNNIIGTGSPLIIVPTNTGIFTYYVNEVGSCPSAIDSIVVTVVGVTAIINATPLSGPIPLNVFFGNGSSTGPGISYLWNFGTGDTSSLFEPSYTYTNSGTYTVTLTVTDANGCRATVTITIEAFSESALLIPNIFTPNGDGFNDFFSFEKINIISIKGEIYNRWGQKMFSWNDLDGSWDGKNLSGNKAPDGTYFYIIEAVGIDGIEYLKKGSFSLIR